MQEERIVDEVGREHEMGDKRQIPKEGRGPHLSR